MCGICGIIDFGQSMGKAQREQDTALMMKRMRHRGPNNEALHSDDMATLGSVRLSIQDLSDAGSQPWIGRNTGQVLVFNGEIYNAETLYHEQLNSAFPLYSTCDTEILSAYFEKSGEAVLDHLRGMFAFAVWDRRTQTLFTARDRIGEKPLIYYRTDKLLVFASEINALLALSWIPCKPNWEGLHHGLHFVHVPAPYTAFKNLHKLPPATCLQASPKDFKTRRYWLYGSRKVETPDTYEEGVVELRNRLSTITKNMSSAQVPVGALLSGGLDSSSVVASLGERAKGIPTFRISHPGKTSLSERMSAHSVAERYGTKHLELTLPENAMLDMENIVRAYAEPVATLVSIDVHRVCKQMANHVTVVLTGNGSDELFGGYKDHCIIRDHAAVQRQAIRELFVKEFTAGQNNLKKDFLSQLQQRTAMDPSSHYGRILLNGPTGLMKQVYSPSMQEFAKNHSPVTLMQNLFKELNKDLETAMITQQLMLSCQYSLVDHSDISGMAFSMEMRSPFLDADLMDWAASIPSSWKIGEPGGNSPGKQILRDAMSDLLPGNVFNLNKFGFGYSVPYAKWINKHWDRLYRREALADSGKFDVLAIERLRKDMLLSKPQSAHIFCGILSLGMWLELYGG